MDYETEAKRLMQLLQNRVGLERAIAIMRKQKGGSKEHFVEVEEAGKGEFRPNLTGERTIKVCAL